MREEMHAAAQGDLSRLVAFANRLTAHVRFEEGELFPTCERCLPADVLDEVHRVAPKH